LWLWGWLKGQHISMNFQVSLVALVVIVGLGSTIVQLLSFRRTSKDDLQEPSTPATSLESSKPEKGATPSGGMLYPIKVTLGPTPQVFVSHVRVGFDTLPKGYLNINITFVCCAKDFSLEKPAIGGIAYKRTSIVADPKLPEPKPTILDTPQIENVASLSSLVLPEMSTRFTIHRGLCALHLKQYVSPSDSGAITATTMDPNSRLAFYFDGLLLNLASPDLTISRFPLWDGVSCFRGFSFDRIIATGVSLSVGP
jgi:hypothetical protein